MLECLAPIVEASPLYFLLTTLSPLVSANVSILNDEGSPIDREKSKLGIPRGAVMLHAVRCTPDAVIRRHENYGRLDTGPEWTRFFALHSRR